MKADGSSLVDDSHDILAIGWEFSALRDHGGN